ncbi:MAG: sulfatase [Chloroflexi bacterium]|nr:sulfatase [Chloroflexota bacterium]
MRRVLSCVDWAKGLIVLIALLFSSLPHIGGSSIQAHAATRPNIVLIVTDDMRVDDLEVMPRARELLAARGTTFANSFVTTPGCCPSRASILRGQYTHNHGVLRSSGEFGGFDRFHALGEEDSTLATWLHAAGYRTALIGKYLNEYPRGVEPTYVPPGWDEWAAATKEGYFGYELNEGGELVRYGKRQDDYSTDVFAAKAVEFVQRSAAAEQPFFLYLAPRAPHAPAEPAPRHEASFAGATAPRGPAFDEADVSDKPGWVYRGPPLTAPEVRQIDEEYRGRSQALLAVDDLIAALDDALAASGVDDETYVVFTSDNGYHLGEHRQLSGKGTPYDESIKVPLVVRGPGVAAGRVEDRLVLNADLAPTFAELAGATSPDFVDGRSLVPLLRGELATTWRQALLVQYYRLGLGTGDPEEAGGRPEAEKQPSFRLLVTANGRYVEYEDGERELYDVASDPYQLDNRFMGTDPGELERLSAWLSSLADCAEARCRALEDAPAG